LEAGEDLRTDEEVEDHLRSLLEETVSLRFRSDVEVGICLSGGLDSSLLLGLIQARFGNDKSVNTFTFYTEDPAYDELPWVRKMLEGTKHRSHICLLTPPIVPELAERVQRSQDEPFGGFPTLGMALVHERAKREGVKVLLDGNGMDEGWAGYDYYQRIAQANTGTGFIQGTTSSAVRPHCLMTEFAAVITPFSSPSPFNSPLPNMQYRDIRYSKIPRAMRFADRVSMMQSRELREPFLDHRIIELGLRQPMTRKIRDGQGKWLPREIARKLLPTSVTETPKRPVQTPQREWLRGPLKDWAEQCIDSALGSYGDIWLNAKAVRSAWERYQIGTDDNSFFLWQWISLGLMAPALGPRSTPPQTALTSGAAFPV
jgi:asparagine synthase (glutamine-hydrolysing)